MKGRDDRIFEEAAELWQELFGEPPPVRTEPGVMLDIIMRSLPEMRYDRMSSPFLRPSQISHPRA